MRLYQIPFSHNCVKVRAGLLRKGLAHDCIDVPPTDRKPVMAATGQPLVPALIDQDVITVGSTAILAEIERRYPEPALWPSDVRQRIFCDLAIEWADSEFMALGRRLAYWSVLSTEGRLQRLFFGDHDVGPEVVAKAADRVRERFVLSEARYLRDLDDAREVTAAALRRLDNSGFLVGDRCTVADLTLAALSAPMSLDRVLTREADVEKLLAWGEPLLGEANPF